MPEDVVYVDEQNNVVAPPKGAGRPGSTSASYPPVINSGGDKADLLDKIRPDVIVETLRHKLMGEHQINGKWEKIDALKNRAVSETCAWDMANLMLPASSQNVALSKLTNEEIRERTLSIVKTAQNMLLKNWREYGIKGTDQLEFVHQIVMSNTFISLKQPEGGGIRDLLKGTTQEQRSVISQEQMPRRGFFRRR